MPLNNYTVYFHGEEIEIFKQSCHKLQVYKEVEGLTKTWLKYLFFKHTYSHTMLLSEIKNRALFLEPVNICYCVSADVLFSGVCHLGMTLLKAQFIVQTLILVNSCLILFSNIPIQLHHSLKNKPRTYSVRSVAQNIPIVP